MNRDPIKEKTMLKKIFSYQIVLYVFSTLAFSVEVDTSYSVKWSNTPWGGGGLIPAGPPWNMVGPFDFDGDGLRAGLGTLTWDAWVAWREKMTGRECMCIGVPSLSLWVLDETKREHNGGDWKKMMMLIAGVAGLCD